MSVQELAARPVALVIEDDPDVSGLLDTVLTMAGFSVLTAENADRSGYVPNVVYTCGALKVADRLFVPYGISDSSVGFATVKIDDLLQLMV